MILYFLKWHKDAGIANSDCRVIKDLKFISNTVPYVDVFELFLCSMHAKTLSLYNRHDLYLLK